MVAHCRRRGGSLGRCVGSLLEMWWLIVGDVVAHWEDVHGGSLGRCGGSLLEIWCCLLVSAPDFWGRGSGFESGISHNDPDTLQDHFVIM